jgi:hypothetical protein
VRGRAVAALDRRATERDGVTARLELDEPLDDSAGAALAATGLRVEPLGGTTYRVGGAGADGLIVALAAWLPSSGRRVRSLRVGSDELEALLLDDGEVTG